MSAPVDVLAVIDEATTWAQQVADRGDIPQGVKKAANGQAHGLREARAAVAELIAAANGVLQVSGGTREHIRLIDALARIGGAA